MRFILLIFVCSLWTSFGISAQTFSSSEKQVQLIELYTSEGCSSCPPADNFLSKFLDDPTLWNSRIPIAIHVDYWDYIGWKDRFASKENSARQRLHAKQGNVSQVYTPGFIVAGEEWRSWFLGDRTIPSSKTSPGVLKLVIDKDTFSAKFQGGKGLDKILELHVALLGFDLKNDVSAGENHGRKLKHNFVLLNENVVSSKTQQWAGELPALPSDFKDIEKLGVVAWVNEKSNIRPVQATGGWLVR